ncbi:MAG: hypothetical protein MJ025_05700, partial [Victivallaceae bacterium]|nr:hypothetical protein [Victivallaceae bacterium]
SNGGAAYSSYRRIDGDGNPLPTKAKTKHFPSGMIMPNLFQKNVLLPSATLLPTSVFENKSLRFDPRLKVCEDYELFLRLSMNTPFFFCDTPVTLRRRHGSNLSAATPRNAMTEYEMLRSFAETVGLPRQLSDERLAVLAARTAREYKKVGDHSESARWLSNALRHHFSLATLLKYLAERCLAALRSN